MRTISAILILSAALASACVYVAPVSQGNVVEQEDVDQLEIGMTRSQVRFLLGTPMIEDPFHADRWDYVFYLKIGRRDAISRRWVSVHFEDELVSRIDTDQELSDKL